MAKRSLVSDTLYRDDYPASWFAVMPSRRLRKEDRAPADAFGRRLVVWRDRAGQAHVQQRFCPHMGASLACGEVQGERLVCPFHHWEYSAEGACTRIPYMDESRIPKGARLDTFPVVEQCGWIWAFNGEHATHELPAFPEYGASGFGLRTKTQRFASHPLLMLENGCDAQHFKYVHKVEFEKYEVTVTKSEKHDFAFDVLQTLRAPAGRTFTITTSLAYVGASLIYGRLKQNDQLFAAFVAAPTPVAHNVTDFTLIVAVRSLPWYLAFLNPLYCSFMARRLFRGATDDYFPVWKDMDARYRGALVAEDGLQQRFRSYYRSHLQLASS